jgi:hypothetical protein
MPSALNFFGGNERAMFEGWPPDPDACPALKPSRFTAVQCAAIWAGAVSLGWVSFLGAGYGLAELLNAAF